MEAVHTKHGFASTEDVTAEEVTEGIDASSKTALITGASSGLGAKTAQILAMRGACVLLAVRNMDAGEHIKERILQETPNARLYVLHLDLNSMASIHKFCNSFKSLRLPLNILINNAGILKGDFELSEDGYEAHFAINHLGHFLLTNLLLEDMKRTIEETDVKGKIINVSSNAHNLCPSAKDIQLDTINDKSRFNTLDAYGLSKLANILHANELARRFKDDNVDMVANSVHPGLIFETLIFRDFQTSVVQEMTSHHNISSKTLSQGAASICFLALHPSVENCSGKYFDGVKEGTPNELCKNESLAKELWDFSLKATSTIKF